MLTVITIFIVVTLWVIVGLVVAAVLGEIVDYVKHNDGDDE